MAANVNGKSFPTTPEISSSINFWQTDLHLFAEQKFPPPTQITKLSQFNSNRGVVEQLLF